MTCNQIPTDMHEAARSSAPTIVKTPVVRVARGLTRLARHDHVRVVYRGRLRLPDDADSQAHDERLPESRVQFHASPAVDLYLVAAKVASVMCYRVRVRLELAGRLT